MAGPDWEETDPLSGEAAGDDPHRFDGDAAPPPPPVVIDEHAPIWTEDAFQRVVADRYFTVAHHRADFSHEGGIPAVEAVLRKRHYTVEEVRVVDGATHLFAHRYLWSQYGTVISHLALIMLMVGALLTRFGGFDNTLALAENSLRRAGTGASAVPTNAAAAERLGWPLTTFNRKLDTVCDKYSAAVVKGLRGGPGELATNRRARLVEYVLSARIITAEHLEVLDGPSGPDAPTAG